MLMLAPPSTRLARVAVGVLLSAMASTVTATAVAAQNQQAMQQAMQSTIQGALADILKSFKAIQVTPSTVTVDAKTHTIALQLVNTLEDSVPVKFRVQYTKPQDLAQAGAAAASTTDSLGKLWSLASWVQELPQVTLAPHETRAVTLSLTVPEGLKPGEYSAYLIALGQIKPRPGVSSSMQPGDLKAASPTSVSKLIYKVGTP